MLHRGCSLLCSDSRYFLLFAHHGAFRPHAFVVFLSSIALSISSALALLASFAKEPLYSLKLGRCARKLGPPRFPAHQPLSRFAMIVFSFLVGVSTHILLGCVFWLRIWTLDHLHFSQHQGFSSSVRSSAPGCGYCSIFGSRLSAILPDSALVPHWYSIAPIHS